MYEIITEMISQFVRDHLAMHIIPILLSTTMLVISMGVDLVFGIRKAKTNGEVTTSTGLKKTCEKARKYFSPYSVLVCIDLIGCTIMPLPFFSMIWAAYCVFCEFVSVREKSWEKEELRKQERTMSLIIENKDDIAEIIKEILTKEGKQ